MKKADIGVVAYIVSAFVMMIIPIPSVLLDLLLACNIAIAFAIMFTAMFSKEVLDMSYFPTILLFTTIFRIALNISSTRLILTTGDPGEVVETFGNFVGGGDLIVGAIIFIILLLVQFMIINKGSERVAEVTARFTLDAMPGKQMAIDADLNTGAITDAEAKIRREKIQAESAFFGSMDGATKYVKGDAAAGLIITLVNPNRWLRALLQNLVLPFWHVHLSNSHSGRKCTTCRYCLCRQPLAFLLVSVGYRRISIDHFFKILTANTSAENNKTFFFQIVIKLFHNAISFRSGYTEQLLNLISFHKHALCHVNFLLVNRYGKEITLSHIPNFGVGKVNRVHGFFEIFLDLLVVSTGIRDVEANLGLQ